MEKDKAPRKIKIIAKAKATKVKTKGIISALVRTSIDAAIGGIGGGTIPEWIKAFDLKKPIEQQAFELVATALMDACRAQMKQRFEQVYQENKHLVVYNKELKFDILSSLKKEDYYLHCDHLQNPQALPLLHDFKDIYDKWLMAHFQISAELADLMMADFPDFFAVAFYQNLKSGGEKYLDLRNWCNDPLGKDWEINNARRRYKASLKNYHLQAALGQENVALSDIYIEPDFLVYDRILSGEKQRKIREASNIKEQEHFLPSSFKGSIHDYLSHHFLQEKTSKVIDAQAEKSRLLILLGQPGHGKSSFCYRSMHDLIRNRDFNGNVFFIRLQNVSREMIHHPLKEIEDCLPSDIDFEHWIDPKHEQKVVLFLDGLDEMFMTQSLSDADVLRMIDNLKKLLAKRTNLYIVITSRFNYVETSKLYNGDCVLFSLGSLSLEQQEQLIKKFMQRSAGKVCNLNEAVLEKCNEEEDYEHIRELIELPILLQMILMSEIDLENAQSKASIYQKLFETVLQRKWDTDQRLKKYKDDTRFKPEHLRKYLSLLAYKIFENNKGYLHKSEIEALPETAQFKRRYLRLEGEEENLQMILKDILTSFYLKESRKKEEDRHPSDRSNEYAIEFLHKSLYEYLACEYLWQQTKSFFLAWDSENEEYQDYELKTVQVKIQSLFGNIRLRSELMGYLREIIGQDQEKQSDLLEQMAYYLPKLLKQGFLAEYPQKNKPSDYTAEQQVLNCFHGFWVIFGELNSDGIRIEDYADSSWSDFEQKYAENLDKVELIKAFTTYQQKRIAEFSKLLVVNESIIAELQKETQYFANWLVNNKDTRTTQRRRQNYENWLRRFFYQKDGCSFFQAKLKACEKEKDHLIRFVRLLAAERFPMQLNFSFLNWSVSDLSVLKMYRVNLIGSDLSYVDLSHTDFHNADLSHADLSHANLNNAYLRNAYLFNVDLSNAYLFNADLFDANLNNADLHFANLGNAYLNDAYLSCADLSHADLFNADLFSINLRYASLRHANLSHADLRHADLCYADLSHVNLRSTSFLDADLSHANLSHANFRHANLRHVNLRHARVAKIDWIASLLAQNIIGGQWIQENYQVNEELKTFTDRYGNEYEAYEIIAINTTKND